MNPSKSSMESHRGAVQSKTGFVDRSRSYWAHHRGSFVDSFKRLLAMPVQTLMTSLVVAIAVALPMTLLLVLDNVNTLDESWDSSPTMSIYLNIRTQQAAINQLIAEIELFPEVDTVVFLSQEDALVDFQLFSGFGKALETLDQNPLPPTIIISPKADAMEPYHLESLYSRLQTEAIIDDIVLDMEWVRRLQEIMLLGRKIVFALAILLGIGVLLAIGNTIRLAIENRRDEILVTKLVGGTDGFVRRPFLYSGGWYGMLGGVLACIIIALGYATLEPSVLRLAELYRSEFLLQGLGLVSGLRLLVVTTALGWIGAWIAVGRHLRHIEPR